MPFGMEKLEWWCYPKVKKVADICNCLHTIPACDGRTERQTDGRADIVPRHDPRYAYASRGKNRLIFLKVVNEHRVARFFVDHSVDYTWQSMCFLNPTKNSLGNKHLVWSQVQVQVRNTSLVTTGRRRTVQQQLTNVTCSSNMLPPVEIKHESSSRFFVDVAVAPGYIAREHGITLPARNDDWLSNS